MSEKWDFPVKKRLSKREVVETEAPEILEGEIVEKNNVVPFAPNLPISKVSLETAKENRRLLTEFIQSQMREGIDYGIIPGTPKPSLYKPGAEKLAKLFNLTIQKEMVDKEIDRHGNFALFIYRASVKTASGIQLAQCEGVCNSQEAKYRERRKYNPDRSFIVEETPICDVLNTLMKMAQKRAMVGAVIEAVGASDFYTQDIEDDESRGGGGNAGPAKVKVSIPATTSAKSTHEGEAPVCCERPMMVSKWDENTWYCVTCKAKQPRG